MDWPIVDTWFNPVARRWCSNFFVCGACTHLVPVREAMMIQHLSDVYAVPVPGVFHPACADSHHHGRTVARLLDILPGCCWCHSPCPHPAALWCTPCVEATLQHFCQLVTNTVGFLPTFLLALRRHVGTAGLSNYTTLMDKQRTDTIVQDRDGPAALFAREFLLHLVATYSTHMVCVQGEKNRLVAFNAQTSLGSRMLEYCHRFPSLVMNVTEWLGACTPLLESYHMDVEAALALLRKTPVVLETGHFVTKADGAVWFMFRQRPHRLTADETVLAIQQRFQNGVHPYVALVEYDEALVVALFANHTLLHITNNGVLSSFVVNKRLVQ